MPKCTVVIPCYNEANRLDAKQFQHFMDRHPEISFRFVNDGSTDDTGAVLRNLCADRNNADWLDLKQNCGKAEAIRAGMLPLANDDSSGDFIGFWDADLATSLEEIPRFLAAATTETLMISGCRLLRLGGDIRRTLWRHILGRSFATIISCYLDLPVYDTQCGAKLYARKPIAELIAQPFATQWFFDVEILKRMVKRFGRDHVIRNCCEFPLRSWKDVRGSKLHFRAAIKDFFRLLRTR